MNARFAELDWRETPMGEISLRRRFDPLVKTDVYEVKLGEEYLMSSLFTAAEEELARKGLAAVSGDALDVVVGGLGLGFTARTVLEDGRVREMCVIDALDAVIEWHRRGLLPFAEPVTADERSRLIHADFFAMARGDSGFDPVTPGRRFHAILLDVDHSPNHVLHPSHAGLYTPDGLRALRRHVHTGGVFGLWSNDPAEDDFTATLTEIFGSARAEIVSFANPIQGGESTNTIYVATKLGD